MSEPKPNPQLDKLAAMRAIIEALDGLDERDQTDVIAAVAIFFGLVITK